MHILNEEKVIMPSEYLNNKAGKPVKNYAGKIRIWTVDMLSNILQNPMYCGKTVTGKSRTIGPGTKKMIWIPKEQYIVTENTHEELDVYPDGGNGGNHNDQKCEEYIKYLNYYNTNVFYLPGKMIPEEIVLKSKYAKEMYRSIMEQFEIINSKNAKDVIKAISKADHGDEEHINGTISILTNKWSQEKSELRDELIDKLNTIFER